LPTTDGAPVFSPAAAGVGAPEPPPNAFSHLARTIRAGAWLLDLASGRTWVSEPWEALVGAPAGHFSGETDATLAVLSRDQQAQVTAYRRAVSGGAQSGYSLVLRYRCVDGNERHVLSRAELERDPDGRPVRLRGADVCVQDQEGLQAAEAADRRHVLDLTRQLLMGYVTAEKSEAAHHAALAHLLSLTSATDAAIVRITPDDRSGQFEERARTPWRLGADGEALPPLALQRLCEQALSTRAALVIANLPAQASTLNVTVAADAPRHFCAVPLIMRDRIVGLVALLAAEPAFTPAALERLSPFLSALSQILDTETAERRRLAAERELRSTELVLSVATNSIDAPISVWDKDDRLLRFNDSFLDMFPSLSSLGDPRGLAYERFMRDHAEPLIDQERLPPAAKGLMQDFLSGRHRDAPMEVPLKSGRWLMVRRRPIPGIGVVAMSTDITDIKRREVQAQRQREELESKNTILEALTRALRVERDRAEMARIKADQASAAKSQFLAHMSHELRTPLNAILGFSEMIEAETFGPVGVDRYKDYAHAIWQSGRHLLSLINDVLDMSRIEAGKLELNRAELDLAECCAEAVQLAAKPAGTDSAPVQIDLPETIKTVWADRRILIQMMVNLLANALKFTPAAGQVRICAERRDGMIALSVQDTGIGMTEAQIQKALTPFGQVEGYVAKSEKGTGLGLPLVRGMAEAHGGYIGLRSTPGAGTCVTVYLPESGPGRAA